MSNPCSYRIQILQELKRASEFVKSRSILQENYSGDPYFYSFNILSELIGNAREKNEKILQKEPVLLNKNVLFSTFLKNPLRRILLKSPCIFLF